MFTEVRRQWKQKVAALCFSTVLSLGVGVGKCLEAWSLVLSFTNTREKCGDSRTFWFSLTKRNATDF